MNKLLFYFIRMDHQYTKLLRMHIRAVMGPCYCLRHRMLHFLQNFVYYMTLEVPVSMVPLHREVFTR